MTKLIKNSLLITIILTTIFVIPIKNVNSTTIKKGTKLQDTKNIVFLIKIDGTINPGRAEFFLRALKEAQIKGASCLVVELDTPGGLLISLRKMVKAILSSSIPVIVYVYPPGARAASAGALLCISAHVAAMAPETNIGACHPVTLFGSLPKHSTMAKKLENDLVAWAKSIAIRKGRNSKWVEKAIRESISSTDEIALKEHVIDIIAPNLDYLLKHINKKTVRLRSQKTILHTYPYELKVLTPNIREKVLSLISEPNIAYILLMIALVGLYFEFAHPGGILPGTIGAISLILSLFAMQALPINVTGLLLIIFAAILLVLELFIPSHGVLTIFGIISLFLGSMFLFPGGKTGVGISASVAYPTLIFITLCIVIITYLATKASLLRPRTGKDAIIGKIGFIQKIINENEAMVFVHGELWRAKLDKKAKEGEKVLVKDIKDMLLIVEVIKNSEED